MKRLSVIVGVISMLLFVFSVNADAVLVGWWQCEELSWDGTADEVKDSSGEDNHGTAFNGATTTEHGKVGRGGTFDGANDYVNLGSPASFDNMVELTYAAWIKNDTYQTSTHILGKDTLFEQGFFIQGTSLKGYIGYSDKGAYSYSTVDAITDTDWHHVAMTYSESGDRKVRLYLDGNEVEYSKQDASAGTLTDTSANDLLISGTKANKRLDGSIDDVRIYNTALGESEIKNLIPEPSALLLLGGGLLGLLLFARQRVSS